MNDFPKFEFHVSRAARDRYGFDESLFGISGNVVFANLAATRSFAQRMNLARDAEHHPELAVRPGELNAMGLIDEALHALIALYRERRDRRVLVDALEWFEARLGRESLDRTLITFADQFPTLAVYRGEVSAREWLPASTAGTPNRAIALEELILLWTANLNPAFKPFQELFDDDALASSTAYPGLTAALREYFETRPRFGPENQNLIDMLRAPAMAAPDSLAGQLAYIREKWESILGDFMRRLLIALDILKEEEIAVWLRYHPAGTHLGGAQMKGDSSAAAIPHFDPREHEYERFSSDVEWMPRTVLIAKTVYVWLDQLSKAYGRGIHRLDEIPNEELDTLARRGFTSLWLIGVWERSRASQRIKQLTGNPEAVASAYSLYDYSIAEDLGGEAAYMNLRDRAWSRGIRLASDMVPNHMGIDSRWVIQHPQWFISLPYPPFPSYSYNGPDLSSDGRVEIKVEDHYYNRSDAAVTFRRADRWTGDARYVYHGNDGTSFPWNDTAQLNYLNPEVREAVIQTILHVARLFPIIRFDAAMTLTKRHYQRLWFPDAGMGGAIPSRSEYGLSKADFDRAMPNEFWREVVDRVAAEVPGTLLLAEAFWLMEGYFVRTLGMHRVYNSAFMNMLRDEENANYRSVMKNTLEFDPEVLKRYVNFMNNPDERTAVDQFGKGDKYFGVCTMMVTLPGLPMFGHGQVEGYTERYGMEYRRAYHDERPDNWLVARHEREISPLLHRRAQFAEVSDFLLYDFYTEYGTVNEDVYAYSNRHGYERALVVYHNRYADTSGWIRVSCGFVEKMADGGKRLTQRTLGDSFNLSRDRAMYVAFRDAVTGLEYLQRACEVAEKGMRLELGAYKYHVFLDWRDLRDDGTRPWGALCDQLAGRGVSSLDDALRSLELEPVCAALRSLLDAEIAEGLAEITAEATSPALRTQKVRDPIAEAVRRARTLLEQVSRFIQSAGAEPLGIHRPGEPADLEQATHVFESRLRAAVKVPSLEKYLSEAWSPEACSVLPGKATENAPAVWATILAFCALEAMAAVYDPGTAPTSGAHLFDALRLREPFAERFAALGLTGEERWRAAARLRAAFAHAAWAPGAETVAGRSTALFSWLHDPEIAWLIGVHEHEGIRYFVREPFERLQWWMALRALIALASAPRPDREAIQALGEGIQARMRTAEEAGYRVEALLESSRERQPTTVDPKLRS